MGTSSTRSRERRQTTRGRRDPRPPSNKRGDQMAVTELTRVMEIATPLGPDLEFHRMSLSEGLARLSEAEVELLSRRNDIAFSDMLSQNVTVKLELPNGERFFNGYVT